MNDLLTPRDGEPIACPPDPAQESCDERALRTEASLVRWRVVAAERRAVWQAEQARLAAERQAWRDDMRRKGLAVFASVAVIMLATMWWWPSPAAHRQTADAATEPAATKPSASLAALPPTVAVPAIAEPVAPTEALERLVAPVPAAVPVSAGSTRTWRADGHAWIAFDLDTPDPAWMRWRDAAGEHVLADMLCFKATSKGHHCTAGRSLDRIEQALADGAAPGTWTVEVCTERGCTDVSDFETADTPVAHS